MCCHSPIVWSNCTASCSINRFTILFHPLSHLCQALYSYRRKFPIRLRADIHQKIGILTGCLHQIVNQCLCRFIILVGNLISPHTIHCFASFQRQTTHLLSGKPRSIFTGQIAFENLDIFSIKRRLMMIIVHYSLNIFSEIPFYGLSLYISYLQMFSFGLNTHEISWF